VLCIQIETGLRRQTGGVVEFVFLALVMVVLATLVYSLRELRKPARSFPSMRNRGHDHSDHDHRHHDAEETPQRVTAVGLDAQAS
jgi:hypothetical protein